MKMPLNGNLGFKGQRTKKGHDRIWKASGPKARTLVSIN